MEESKGIGLGALITTVFLVCAAGAAGVATGKKGFEVAKDFIGKKFNEWTQKKNQQ